MIRAAEAVLPGHPDKLCDQIADAIVAEAVAADRDAYAQIEVGLWADHLWLSGGLCARRPLDQSLELLAWGVLHEGGYPDLADRVEVRNTVCTLSGDPRRWTESVNDQAVVIGWAGYDAKTRWLAPEQFLAHALRDALAASFTGGALDGHGPDGKLIVRLREDAAGWHLEHLLATVQQRAGADLLAFCGAVSRVAREAYERVRAADARWRTPWDEVETLINPNGPFLVGGSAGDNGQTGRKLVMDYYGPRVPLGGGALSGKHLSHVDRIGAYAAREAAVRAVASGAKECLVRLCWAPNVPVPLDVTWQMEGRGAREVPDWFAHDHLRERYRGRLDYRRLAQGTHFVDDAPWNRPDHRPHIPCGDPSCDLCSPPNQRCKVCGALYRDEDDAPGWCSAECAIGDI